VANHRPRRAAAARGTGQIAIRGNAHSGRRVSLGDDDPHHHVEHHEDAAGDDREDGPDDAHQGRIDVQVLGDAPGDPAEDGIGP